MNKTDRVHQDNNIKNWKLSIN